PDFLPPCDAELPRRDGGVAPPGMKRRLIRLAVFALALAVLSIVLEQIGVIQDGRAALLHDDYQLVPAFPGIKFSQPLDRQMPRDGSDRFFVVEKDGRSWWLRNSVGATEQTLFL